MTEQTQGPAYESVEFAQMRMVAEEQRFEQQGWKASRRGGTMIAVRDGHARVIVSWVGGDWFVMSWEYGTGTGELGKDWRAEVHPRDEIVMQWDMTLNAMWR